MNYEIVKDKLGSWAPHLRRIIETPEFDEIFKNLKALSGRRRTVLPAKDRTFRCFQLTPYEDLKVVFVFNSPYDEKLEGEPFADGLGLSSPFMTTAISHFFKAIERDFEGRFEIPEDLNDLSYLASQGVLLLNVALTTELHKHGSHVKLWRPFMNYLFDNVLSSYPRSLPIVFMGEQASTYAPLVMPFNHWVFKISDPMKITEHEDWQHQGIFKKVDAIIRDNHNDFALQWAPALLRA